MLTDKKICFFPGDLNLGGIGHLMINLAHEFIRQGYEVHFFLTTRIGDIENELPKAAKVFRAGRSIKGALLGFIKYLKKEKPYTVISGRDSLNAVNVLGCLLSGVKVKAIVGVHVDYSSAETPKTLRGRVHMWSGYVLGLWAYRMANHIVAVSNGVAENHAKRFFLRRNKIKTIYNPAYRGELDYDGEAEAFINGLSKPVIIGVGRLTRQKGFDILVEAFSLVKKENTTASLVILGEGEERNKLNKLIEELEIAHSVYMPGYVKHPASYIKFSDLFVLSSLWEGFGNVLVEAMGTGVTVVSTDCKSGPREILEDGRYGILTPPDNVEALKGAILESLTSSVSSTQLIDRAKDFSIERIANEYLALLTE